MIARPPESSSSVPNVIASTAGERLKTLTMAVPSCTFFVASASCVRMLNASRPQASATHTDSTPRSSAICTRFTRSSRSAGLPAKPICIPSRFIIAVASADARRSHGLVAAPACMGGRCATVNDGASCGNAAPMLRMPRCASKSSPTNDAVAVRAADIICDAFATDPDAHVGLPTGQTPIAAYAELARREWRRRDRLLARRCVRDRRVRRACHRRRPARTRVLPPARATASAGAALSHIRRAGPGRTHPRVRRGDPASAAGSISACLASGRTATSPSTSRDRPKIRGTARRSDARVAAPRMRRSSGRSDAVPRAA